MMNYSDWSGGKSDSRSSELEFDSTFYKENVLNSVGYALATKLTVPEILVANA